MHKQPQPHHLPVPRGESPRGTGGSPVLPRWKSFPIALTIAGSDSGGGAGIQADLKTFVSLGVHGTCAITCVTAQNPKSVLAIQPLSPKLVQQQLEAVFTQLPPRAAKTGMLFSSGIIREVVRFFRDHPEIKLIVDPVMIATSGARLLNGSAAGVLERELLPIASLVTPNVDEAAALVHFPIKTEEGLRAAARQIQERFGCPALVKGGHLRGANRAVDIFTDGRTELMLSAPFVKGRSTHGTGCTYSAAIAGYCALGHPLAKAVGLAKEYISQAIAQSRPAAQHWVLEHGWQAGHHLA